MARPEALERWQTRGEPVASVTRQEVTFGMTLPEAGDASAAFIVLVRDANGITNRFATMGVLHGMPAGPLSVTVEATLAVADPPPVKLTLRDRLDHLLRVEDRVDQVDAILELLSEQDDLLDQLDELASE